MDKNSQNSFLKYTNGAGHLMMSIIFAIIGLILVLTGNSVIGIPILMTVASAWFIPGAARQVAHEVNKTVSQPLLLDDSGDQTG